MQRSSPTVPYWLPNRFGVCQSQSVSIELCEKKWKKDTLKRLQKWISQKKLHFKIWLAYWRELIHELMKLDKKIDDATCRFHWQWAAKARKKNGWIGSSPVDWITNIPVLLQNPMISTGSSNRCSDSPINWILTKLPILRIDLSSKSGYWIPRSEFYSIQGGNDRRNGKCG